MKKLYLSIMAAAAAMSMSAAEPALTEMWSKIYDWQADAWGYNKDTQTPDWSATEGVMGAATGSRWGIGMNGKVYSINCYNNSLISFDAEGLNPTAVKLPTLEGKKIYYYNTDADLTKKIVSDYYATLLTRDDAGHFIVGHGFTTGAMVANWTVVDPKTGESKTFYQDDMGLGEEPGNSFLRIDAVGRALGDVTKDGVLCVAPTSIFWGTIKNFQSSWATSEKVQCPHVIAFQGEGEFNENMTATGYVAPFVYLGNHTASICQPLYQNMDELWDVALPIIEQDPTKEAAALVESFILYSKAGSDCLENNQYAAQFGAIKGSSSKFENITEPKATDIVGTNWASYAGFDTFVIGGKRYFVANYQTKEQNKIATGMMQLAVFDENGMIVATWNNPDYASTLGYCSISTEPVPGDENSYYIYVYAATHTLQSTNEQASAAAQLKFTAGDQAGIDNIAVDEVEAPAVYYNLQGVEVANPENGIYVVRRGNKVTKEVIR